MKRCSLGDHDVPKLWKSHPKACKTCWEKHQRKIKSEQPKAPVIKNKSTKDRKQELERERQRKYAIAKAEHFNEYPVCQFPGCNRRDISLHHGAGKTGKLLYDKKYFKSLCWDPHHLWVESHPDEAKAMGLSFTRLDK